MFEDYRYKKYAYPDQGFIVHMLTSSEHSFLTNAYLIETENGVVAIDTFMLVSDAQALRALYNQIARLAGKPMLGIIITHGHPDHYNGSSTLMAGFNNVPVISSQGIADSIRDNVDAKEIKWKPFFGDDWPSDIILPNQWVVDGEQLMIDGLQYSFADLGAGESSSDLSITLGQKSSVVFVGDVVFNAMHGFMNDGHTQQWLAVLQRLAIDLAEVPLLFTGHGAPGKTAVLIEAQIDYLQTYRRFVAALAGSAKGLKAGQKLQLEQNLCQAYPEYQLRGFIQAGADAVAAELNRYKLEGLSPLFDKV